MSQIFLGARKYVFTTYQMRQSILSTSLHVSTTLQRFRIHLGISWEVTATSQIGESSLNYQLLQLYNFYN